MNPAEANRAAQHELYGEPLADVFHRLMACFGYTQTTLAHTLGISAPMLSQLMSANRVKIGNPAVVLRLQALQDLAHRVGRGQLEQAQVDQALGTIRGLTGAWTRSESAGAVMDDEQIVATMRQLLRAVASGQELRSAVDLLRAEHPGLANLLESYGLGSVEAGTDHLRAHRPVM